ncbi:unnamed protein product [Timema podura]|uniref:Uncharacterized protein n=1 Tax=Timema podura TaxID=61482 RepID=A0ABN7NNM5_TIMPD|nr:unnamed protein product [Timema podura]
MCQLAEISSPGQSQSPHDLLLYAEDSSRCCQGALSARGREFAADTSPSTVQLSVTVAGKWKTNERPFIGKATLKDRKSTNDENQALVSTNVEQTMGTFKNWEAKSRVTRVIHINDSPLTNDMPSTPRSLFQAVTGQTGRDIICCCCWSIPVEGGGGVEEDSTLKS